MFQLRSESTGMREVPTFAQAMAEAKYDQTIWKISFELPTGERIRLVKKFLGGYGLLPEEWVLSPLMDEVREELKAQGIELP